LNEERYARGETWCNGFRPLVAVWRGSLIEVVHHGAIVAAYPDGRLAGAVGSPDQVVYIRSSAKPLQVLPLLESGAVDHFGFSTRELAIMAGSHSGAPAHVEAVRQALERIGLDESALQCGPHWPFDRAASNALICAGEKPLPIHNNCSGKHTAMLALARYRGYPLDAYYQADHPVQREIIAALSRLSSAPAEQIVVGIDGCGVPVFGLPLRSAAQAFARLVNPAGLSPAWAAACRRIVSAMGKHPDMVAGARRICTTLMETLPGRLVAKSGAEGFYALGILPGQIAGVSEGLGIVVKIADGNFETGVYPVVVEILRQLGVADSDALALLYRYYPLEVRNCRQEVVGDVQPLFSLDLAR
jgi:L-asparaginase II